jgi:hypothetical protein
MRPCHLRNPLRICLHYCLHGHGTSCHPQASTDATLARVAELWPSLPPQTQRAIYSICIDSALFDE